MANRWFLAFHLVGLFIYLGGLLNLSRLLGYHVKENAEVRARLSWMEKRMYFFVTLPGLALALVFGLLMFFGVGANWPEGHGVIENYLKPTDHNPVTGEKVHTAWYVTFHLKLVLVAMLLCLDFYLGKQIVKLGRGGEPPKPVRFKILHGLIALIVITIVVIMVAGPLKGA